MVPFALCALSAPGGKINDTNTKRRKIHTRCAVRIILPSTLILLVLQIP
jgi:hypothetical protein